MTTNPEIIIIHDGGLGGGASVGRVPGAFDSLAINVTPNALGFTEKVGHCDVMPA